MANATIKITQLPSIGNGLTASTILPVVNTTGTATTDKVAIGNIANFILTQAGNTLPPAFVSNLAYSVANAAQPNITSVGNLIGLTLTNLANFHIPGGTNGYVLQTNGNGNLSWVTQSGVPGGSNTQVQFNDGGVFGGNIGLTYNKTNTTLTANNFVATTTANLGAVGNVKITGGSNGQVLTTFGNGTLSWTSPASNSLVNGNSNVIVTANSNVSISASGNANVVTVTGNALYVSSTLESTGGSTGSIGTAGGLGVQGNIFGNSRLYIGAFSNATNLLSPVAVFKGAGPSYVQVAALNTLDTGSADLVSYGDNGNDTFGWADMGFTGSNFADANYTITGSNDGYLFAQAQAGKGGNLVIATGGLGTVKDIIFATSGFLVANEFARISHANNSFELTRANASITFPDGSIQDTAYTGGADSELVNGNNSFVLDSAGNVVFEGNVAGQAVDRGLVWDYGANANGVNSMVRQDNNGITVRAWTEQGGGANGYSAPVNIVTNQDATTKTWTFDGSGNLTLPGNLNIPTGNIVSNIVTPAFNSAITSIVSTGNANVIITIASELFEGPASGQVTISGVNPPVQANDTWYYEAVEIDQFQLYTDANLTTPVDGSSWPGYVDGGTAVGIGAYGDLTVQGGNVAIGSNDNTWTFDTNGAITLPSATGPGSSAGYIQTANAYPTLLAYGSGGHGGPELDWMDGDNPNDRSNANVIRNTLYLNDEGLYVGMNENGVANTFIGSWTFTPNGTTIFPTLEVDLHNGGVQEGQVLQFGNSSQQVIITGPTPSANVNAQRLIIQGQRGNSTNSEGGDVYVWAGDAELYGGDIKIYAGDADDTADGYGGYVNIDGGQGFTEGGHIALNGGQSSNGPGGYVEIYAGQGNSHGGNLTLGAGYGLAGPGGAVTIQGGGSGNGLSAYGNVGISAGASSWTFDNAGNLTLPANTFSVNYANGVQVSIGGGSGNTGNVTFDNNIVIGTGDEFGGDGLFLAPGNGSIANSAVQYLRVRGGDYPTHIHLDTGNNQYYDQYFGADGRYVKLEANGNVVINADDYLGNSATWTLTIDGNLILANGNSVIQSIANSSLDPVNPNVSTMVLTPDPGYSTQSLVLDPTAPGHIHLRAPGANIDEPSANIFLGGEDSSFEVGYYNGAAPNVFIHSNTNTWTFDNSGNLNFPTNGNINFDGGGITQAINKELNIVVQDEEDDGWSIFNTITDGLGNNLSQTQLDSGSFTIGTASGGNTYSWSFEGNTLQVSTNSQIRSFGSNITLQAMSSGSGGTASLQSVSNTNDPNIFTTFDATTTGANITVYNGGSNGGTGNTWRFDNTGVLTVPGEGIIQSIQDTIILQSVDANSNVYSARLGTNGGLYFATTQYPQGWLDITNNSGNANITAASGTAGSAGKNMYITAGAADQSDFYTTSGGSVNLTGGLGASDDGGGGGPGGNVNIASGLSADPAGHAGNINITAGSNDWIFDYDGTLTVPGNLVYIGASPAPYISGFSSANFAGNVTANYFLGNGIQNGNSNITITSNGNVSIQAAGSTVELVVTSTGANVTGTLDVTGNTTVGALTASSMNLTSATIAIGGGAGETSQGLYAVAVGHNAGSNTQGDNSVAIGLSAGLDSQSDYAVAIGPNTGQVRQGNLAVAIGYTAGLFEQGKNSIAIGANAGYTNQGNNSIILNATGANLNQTTANTFTVSPVRNDVANIAEVMFYNTTSKEVTYGNTISVAGNVTGANISTSGNISGNTNGFAIGYLNIPQVAASNTTLALGDAGKHYYSTTAGNFTLTVPNNATTAFATGTAISIVVQAAGNILVNADTGVTLYMAGNSTAANRVVGGYGMATLMKVATDTWFINGTGVS